MRQQPIAVEHDGVVTNGTVYLPDGKGPFPAVMLLHGLGADRIEMYGMFALLATNLVYRGFAVVTPDLRFSGKNDRDPRKILPTDWLVDSLAMTRWLQQQDFIDPKRLGLLGISLGGLVACCTVGRTPAYRALALTNPTTPQNLLRVLMLPDYRAGDSLHYGDLTCCPQFATDILTLDPLHDCLKNPRPTLVLAGGRDTVVPAMVSWQFAATMKVHGIPVTHVIEPEGNHSFTSTEVQQKLFDHVSSLFASTLTQEK
jgi:uncharacterized protein